MENEDDDKLPRQWGDVGFIVLMGGVGLFTLSLIVALLLGYHPYAVLFASPPPAKQAPAPSQTMVTVVPEKPK